MAKTNFIQQARDAIASLRNKTLNSSLGQNLRNTWQTPVTIPQKWAPQTGSIATAGRNWAQNTVIPAPQFVTKAVQGINNAFAPQRDFTNKYLTNNYAQPILNIPQNARMTLGQGSTPGQRIQGALGTVGGLAAIAKPDVISDVAMPVFNMWKGMSASAQQGENIPQRLQTGIKSLSGEAPVGLGNALTKDPTTQTILNLAEIPLMLYGGMKATKKLQAIKNLIKDADMLQSAIRFTRNIDEIKTPQMSMNVMAGTDKLVAKHFPQLLKDKDLQAVKVSSPATYYNYISQIFEGALKDANNPQNLIPGAKQGFGSIVKSVRDEKGNLISPQGVEGTGGMKPRGLVTSVQEAPNISGEVKTGVQGTYTPKPNTKLMGEAQALLQENASLDLKAVQGLDKKVAATIQEAINLQKKGDYEAAANLFNNLSESGTEIGRGTQAFSLLNQMSPEAIALSAAGKIKKFNLLNPTKKIPELTGAQTKQIADKVTEIDLLKGRERNIALNELNNLINDFIPSSLGDKITTVWKAGLLTSLRTHERNFIGNAVHGLAETLKDVPASLADIAMSAKTGKRTVTATTQGLGSFGSKSTGQQMKDIIMKGYDPSEQINKFDYHRITWGKNPIEKALKVYTDAVFRTLGASDKPFYNAAMSRSLYDQAGAAAINAGKRGDKAFIESLVSKPTEEMLKNAISDANVATFKDKTMASNAAGNLKRALGEKWYGKILGEVVMPFIGVPSSVFTQIKNYSPVGLLQGIARAGKVTLGNMPDMQRLAAQEIGRGAIGTGIFALGAYLMSKGIITGQPKDATEARQWEMQNIPRNSILIGGKYRSLNSIGPEAIVFLSGAKLAEEMGKPTGSIANYGLGIGKDVLDQSFLTGLQGPVNAITDPARYAKSYAGQLISSPIPNIVKDLSKATDKNARETNTVGDYFKLGVPGLRQTLQPKRDVLGAKIKQEPTGINAFVDVFNSKTPINSAVPNEFGRLSKVGEPATPSKLSANQTIRGKKVTLTPEQLNDLETNIGKTLIPYLEALIKSPSYMAQSDYNKSKMIDNLVEKVRDGVKNQWGSSQGNLEMGKNPNANPIKVAGQIASELRNLRTKEERNALVQKYKQSGVITQSIDNQLKAMAQAGQL